MVRAGIEPGITVLQIQPVVRAGIKPGVTVLQIQPVVRAGIEPGITALQIQLVVSYVRKCLFRYQNPRMLLL